MSRTRSGVKTDCFQMTTPQLVCIAVIRVMLFWFYCLYRRR